MPTRSQRIRQRVKGGPIDKLKAEVVDLKEQVKDFKEIVKSNHVIHTDGTYSNAPASVTKRAMVDRYKTLVLEHNGAVTHEIVRDFDKTGVWTKPAAMKRNPSLNECNFWKWHEIDDCLMRVV